MTGGETYLGLLCKRGHDAGDGKSVRYVANNCCQQCQRTAHERWREKITPEREAVWKSQVKAHYVKTAREKSKVSEQKRVAKRSCTFDDLLARVDLSQGAVGMQRMITSTGWVFKDFLKEMQTRCLQTGTKPEQVTQELAQMQEQLDYTQGLLQESRERLAVTGALLQQTKEELSSNKKALDAANRRLSAIQGVIEND